MKFFLFNFVVFLLVILLLFLIPNLFIDKYYGNEIYLKKYEYFFKHKDKYNTVFFGSSRIYRHLNPILFDSLCFEDNIKSFNLGAPAVFNPEVYFLCEEFLKEVDSNSIKHIFIELQPFEDISQKKIKTYRGNYWLNFDYLIYVVRYLLADNGSNKYLKSKEYILAYIYKMIDITKFKYLFGQSEINELYLNSTENGFLSLDEELSVLKTKELKQRTIHFFKDTMDLNKRQLLMNQDSSVGCNLIEYKLVLNLIKTAKNRGIKLYCIIPPRLTDYRMVKAMKKNISTAHIIDISDDKKFHELYLAKYSFDVGHLNKKGSSFFTKYVYNEFNNKKQ